MLKRYYFEDLSVGMKESVSREITEDLVCAFADVSGDHNPLHLDDDYAKKTRFGERIAHGMLSVSFISAVLGTQLPGEGAVYMSQSVRFVAPVKIDDTVDVEIFVTEIIEEKNRVKLETKCCVGDTTVLTGEAMLYVPSRPN